MAQEEACVCSTHNEHIFLRCGVVLQWADGKEGTKVPMVGTELRESERNERKRVRRKRRKSMCTEERRHGKWNGEVRTGQAVLLHS